MEQYVYGLIESIKKDLLRRMMEHKRGIYTSSMTPVTEENVSLLFEGSLMTLNKFAMISSEELNFETILFQNIFTMPFSEKAIHFFFSIKRNEQCLSRFNFVGYDYIAESKTSVTLYKNTGAFIEEVYSYGLLNYMLLDFSNDEFKEYKYSSIEKMVEQEKKIFKNEKPVILTFSSPEEINKIKFLPVGNYILQLEQ